MQPEPFETEILERLPSRRRLRFTASLAVIALIGSVVALFLSLAGCGSGPSPSPPVPQPAGTTYTQPETARTPEGPLNPSPAKPEAPPVTLPRPTAPVKHIDVAGLRLLEGFEGFRSCPYQDVTGVWTRGYGQTHNIGPHSPCISQTAAQAELRWSVESEYEWAIRALGVPFDEHEWDALCSFSYNLGAGIFENTTVGEDLRARRYYAATSVMLQYDHAGGVVLSGLRTRREAEVRLFLTPEPHPKPKPSPAERRHLVRYWQVERRAVLHRYHLDGCRGNSTGPKCTALRAREHALYRDIKENA
jgi:lysozyme